MTVVNTYLPIDKEEMCKAGSPFYDRLQEATRQHFVLDIYKSILNEEIPEFDTGMKNGSYCHKYVQMYIGEISIESSTNSVTKSIREVKATFLDKLGTIGGTLGLFTGKTISFSE